MPRPAKKSPSKQAVTTCPFSGNPLEIVQLSNGDWQVRGTGWVSAKLFPFREHAVWFFSHRDGKPPAGMKNPYRRVEVVGVREPPDPAQAEVTGAVKDAESIGEALVDEVVK